MSKKTERAAELHKKGWNCAQCTAGVFAEELGKNEKDVFEIMEAFGFGMGCMGVCGAVSGMAAVVGIKVSDGNLEEPKTKKKAYQDSKALIKQFEEKIGSTICKDIKGVETGQVLRSCQGCIDDAIEMLEAYLAE